MEDSKSCNNVIIEASKRREINERHKILGNLFDDIIERKCILNFYEGENSEAIKAGGLIKHDGVTMLNAEIAVLKAQLNYKTFLYEG